MLQTLKFSIFVPSAPSAPLPFDILSLPSQAYGFPRAVSSQASGLSHLVGVLKIRERSTGNTRSVSSGDTPAVPCRARRGWKARPSAGAVTARPEGGTRATGLGGRRPPPAGALGLLQGAGQDGVREKGRERRRDMVPLALSLVGVFPSRRGCRCRSFSFCRALRGLLRSREFSSPGGSAAGISG